MAIGDTSASVLSASSSQAGLPLRVLVCDDDVVTRELCKRMLTKLGCIVDVASDGRECVNMVLATAADSPYDAVCLDNFMPVMTGEEAVRELRMLDREEYVVGKFSTFYLNRQIADGMRRLHG